MQWERHPMADCFHIYSDGTRVSVLFEKPEDFVFARNLIAILAFKYHIRVYCDVVMDTHFHLVGHAVIEEDVKLFLPYFDRMYYGLDVMPDLAPLKTTAFAGQEGNQN